MYLILETAVLNHHALEVHLYLLLVKASYKHVLTKSTEFQLCHYSKSRQEVVVEHTRQRKNN